MTQGTSPPFLPIPDSHFTLLVLSLLEVLSDVEGLEVLSDVEGSKGCAPWPPKVTAPCLFSFRIPPSFSLLFSRSDDCFCPSVLKVLSLSMGCSDKMSVSVCACPALASPPLVGKRRRMGLWLMKYTLLVMRPLPQSTRVPHPGRLTSRSFP